MEIFLLAERDVKGLYKKALAGEVPHFTGASDPYDPPLAPEVTIDSSRDDPADSLEKNPGHSPKTGAEFALIDLRSHTYESDGICCQAELTDEALRCGVHTRE